MKSTLKKEIINLINSKQGSVRLNKFSMLVRWTEDVLGSDVDGLSLKFDTLNNICIKGFTAIDIQSRDYDGIISECNIATQKFFEEASRQTINELNAGYWIGSSKKSWVNI